MVIQTCYRGLVRYKRSLTALALFGLVGLGVVWWYSPLFGIGRLSFYRIRAGMTPEEVEQIIGLPPGYYHWYRKPGGFTSSPYEHLVEVRGVPWEEVPEDWQNRRNDPRQNQACLKWWYSEDYAITAAFDESGRVVAWKLEKVDNSFIRGRPTVLDRLWNWLRSFGF